MKKNLNFFQIKNEFNKFKKNYAIKLSNKSVLNDNEYYLINNSWYQILSENLFGNKPKNDINEIFSKNIPILFFNINSIIEFLNIKENKLALISHNIFNLIYEEDKFKKNNLVNFYLGYNNLIIEFAGEKENDILLISNPLEKFRNDNNEFIIKIKNEPIKKKLEFFTDLMSNKDNLYYKNLDKIKNNNIIKTFSHFKSRLIPSKDDEKQKIEENTIDEKYKKVYQELIAVQNKLKQYKNAINQLNNIIKEITKKNSDLEKKVEELTKKENQNIEINNKMSDLLEREKFIEEKKKELEIEKEKFKVDKNENIRIKEENKILNIKKEELEKEIKGKQKELDNLIYNAKENNRNNPIPKNPVLISLDGDMIKNFLDRNKDLNNKNKSSIVSQESFIEDSKPILIGLNNIGATFFMNSILQCLSQTKSLTDYFLNDKNADRIINNNIQLKNKEELQLSPVYCDLIKKLWDKNGPKSISPKNFMNIIEKMNPKFKQGQAGDSKNFIIFVLEQLHKELKRPISGINQLDIALDQYNRLNAFNHFFNDFKKECSIISDTFFGFNEIKNECLNCKIINDMKGLTNPVSYNYGFFYCLIFPLEEIKNLENKKIQYSLNNTISIYDCFYYQQKYQIFSGENRNHCNNCNQLFDSLYISSIFSGPNHLILILDRGKENMQDVKLEFSETIDISQFVLQKESPLLTYNLYGVITCIDQSGSNAHFVASCKNSIDNKWYRFNDDFVSPILNIQKEVIEFGTPYILFYQKN